MERTRSDLLKIPPAFVAYFLRQVLLSGKLFTTAGSIRSQPIPIHFLKLNLTTQPPQVYHSTTAHFQPAPDSSISH